MGPGSVSSSETGAAGWPGSGGAGATGAAADSLGPPRIGRLGYETAARHGTTSVLVDEESLLAARRFLWERVRVLAEPGASAALAALMSGRVAVHPGSTVVVVVSGGNNPALP